MTRRFAVILAIALSPTAGRAAPPNASYLYPAGAQRGTTVEIMAAGTFERWPAMARASGHGISVKSGKDKGRLVVTVAADAEVGRHWLWLYDDQGASVPLPFLVGTLPEVREQEPNDDPKAPQPLPFAAVTVNGRLEKPGDVDCYSVRLQKGQTLVAALEAWSTLRSPMDAVLQVLSPDGFVLEQNNDFSGLDPFVAVPIPADGTYVVRIFAFPAIPDTTIRLGGAENYVYRLTLTTGGYADYPFPLALRYDQPGDVELVGWNIPERARRCRMPAVAEAGDDGMTSSAVPNPIRLRRESHTCLVDPPGTAEPFLVEPPVTISGRMQAPGSVHRYSFSAAKGQKLTLRVESQSLGLTVAAVVRIADQSGHTVAAAEPSDLHGDTELPFAAPADGTYVANVRDLYGAGGPRAAYRLRIAPPAPDFSIAVAVDRFAVAAGQVLELPVAVQRVNGFGGAIDVTVEGLPVCVEWQLVRGNDAAKVTLKLKARPDAIEAGPFRVVGRGRSGLSGTRTATAALPAPFEGAPSVRTDSLWLTVTRPPPPKSGPAQ